MAEQNRAPSLAKGGRRMSKMFGAFLKDEELQSSSDDEAPEGRRRPSTSATGVGVEAVLRQIAELRQSLEFKLDELLGEKKDGKRISWLLSRFVSDDGAGTCGSGSSPESPSSSNPPSPSGVRRSQEGGVVPPIVYQEIRELRQSVEGRLDRLLQARDKGASAVRVPKAGPAGTPPGNC